MVDIWQQEYLNIANKAVLLSTCQQDMMQTSSSAFDACFVYTKGRDDIDPRAIVEFELNKQPEPIECGNAFGDIWAPDYQKMSCCSGDGRYYSMTGQIGTFDFGYNDIDVEINHPRCVGYTQALTAITCSPNQGKYIVNNQFKVCKSACDAVYEACGDPDVVIGDAYNTGWTDGTSLCQAAWGHFSSTNDGVNCAWPDHPFCNVSIEVVDDDTNEDAECLSFIRPNFPLTNDANFDFVANKYCSIENDKNVNANNLCLDIEIAINNTASTGRRLLSSECGNIPMYARSPASRQHAIEQGCFDAASYIKPMSILLSLIIFAIMQ